MQRKHTIASLSAGLAALMLFGEAYGFNLNKSVDVEAGSESGGHSTVNGSISVGADAVVNGALETVNGSIRVDENARIGNAETVNGRVRLASGVTAGSVGSVNGSITVDENSSVEEVSVVNGKIRLGPGAQVARGIGNVNGEIEVTGAEIGGDLETVNGDVTLEENARLRGNLTVEKPGGFNWGNRRKPRIIIGPGVRVDGEIVLEREVELYISDSAEVGGVSGVMSMEDAVRFSGNRP
jgi:hypothetical protein